MNAMRLVLCGLIWTLAGTGMADQAADKKASEAAIYQSLRDVINRGADLYNNGEHAACYRLFEGALMVIKPQLEHRGNLQKEISKGISSAERDPVMWRRAFTLRSVLDKIREETNPKTGDKSSSEKIPMPKADVEKKEPEKKEPEKKEPEKKEPEKKEPEKKEPEKKEPEKKEPEKKELEKKEPEKKEPEKKEPEKKDEDKDA